LSRRPRQKYGLNDLDAAKLTGHLTTLRGHAVVKRGDGGQ
jgi:hypothetical protein